ncbi:MAG: 5-(carboxyamino)imidazole ribonucleotide mutase [Clostridia bacterium]|nr:5-(carboxyamino)imidazole ribonucleotide mutase [Clostridia bacterium]
MPESRILIVMGSDSDLPVMESCIRTLRELGVRYDAQVCSAHRSPSAAAALASSAETGGYGAIIAAAGLAAHLPGVLAAYTTLPVIGVPIGGGPLKGMDALLAIVQMPSGIPVATVAIDGGTNAAVLACQILATADADLRTRLKAYKAKLEAGVGERNRRLQDKLADIK